MVILLHFRGSIPAIVCIYLCQPVPLLSQLDVPHVDRTDVCIVSFHRHLDDVDLFTGGLSEHHVRGGVVGPTFACIIGHQFRNIKFGDRFWFENTEHPGAFTGGG